MRFSPVTERSMRPRPHRCSAYSSGERINKGKSGVLPCVRRARWRRWPWGTRAGVNALIAMGALNMGLSEEELPDIVASGGGDANPENP